MPDEVIILSQSVQSTLRELAGRMGKSPADVLQRIVDGFKSRFDVEGPATSIPGVDPAEVWESYREAEGGQLVDHDELFSRLRNRQ